LFLCFGFNRRSFTLLRWFILQLLNLTSLVISENIFNLISKPELPCTKEHLCWVTLHPPSQVWIVIVIKWTPRLLVQRVTHWCFQMTAPLVQGAYHCNWLSQVDSFTLLINYLHNLR
jgi:hypothetical protein